jgi:hypothetical protein
VRDWRERERGGETVIVSPCVLEMYRVKETSEWHGTLTRSIKGDLATRIGLKTANRASSVQ